MRKMLAGLAIVAAFGGTGIVRAANQPCGSYRIEGPMVGAHQDEKCSPIPLPPPFTVEISPWTCHNVYDPDAALCAEVTTYLPSPP